MGRGKTPSLSGGNPSLGPRTKNAHQHEHADYKFINCRLLVGTFFVVAFGEVTNRRFPPPWTVEEIPGGFKVIDANGQSLAYCYGRESQADADIAKVLTKMRQRATDRS